MTKAFNTASLRQFLPLSVRGISEDGSISFGSEKMRVVIGYITNACSLGDFVTSALKDRRFGDPDTAVTQIDIVHTIVDLCNNSVWQDISSAPKTKPNFEGGAIEVLAWCPDEEAPGGGDRRIVWWEPGMRDGKGCWWSESDIEVFPTLWIPVPEVPETAKQATGLKGERR